MEEKEFENIMENENVEPAEVKEVIHEEKRKNNKSSSEFEEVGPNPNKKYIAPSEYDSKTDSYFDGSFFGLLAYSYLSNFISIFTFGVFKPWANCIYNRYIYNHMVISGKRLKFEGDGADLFENTFKWNFFKIITFGIYSIWVPTRYKEWELAQLHFEDEELVRDESYFTGTVGEYFGINVITWLITVLSFGLLGPIARVLKLRWELSHSIINRKVVRFSGNPFEFLLRKLLWLLLSIVTFGIYGLFIELKTLRWQTSKIYLKRKNGSIPSSDVSSQSIKMRNKLILPIILGIIGIVIIFLTVKVVTFLKPENEEVENEIKTTILEIKNEFSQRDPSMNEDTLGKYKRIKKLNMSSIEKFRKNGGKGFYSMSGYDYYENSVGEYELELYLYKKNILCSVRLNNKTINYQRNIECNSFRNYIKGAFSLKENKKVEYSNENLYYMPEQEQYY